jgi:5-methylcytosine-specific restriction endonuclease McrA
MGSLRNIRPRIGVMPPRLKRGSDDEGHGEASEPWRKWYHWARWKHPQHGLRIRVLLRDLFTCQWPGCGRCENDTSQLVADHKTPHRGDPDLFWDEDNLWTLCKPHHDGAKQAQERRSARG